MSQSTIRNIIISSILILIAISAFGFMVYRVLWQGDQLTAQIATLEEERAQEASYYRLLKLSEETYPERAELKKHFLLKESESIDFLNQVETLAPQAGVELKTEGLELITDPNDQSEWIQVQFSFAGLREDVQRFVQILETLPYVLRVTAVSMEARSSTEWAADVTLQVQVLDYDK